MPTVKSNSKGKPMIPKVPIVEEHKVTMLDVIAPFHKKYMPPETHSSFKMQRLSTLKQNAAMFRGSNVSEMDSYLMDQTFHNN